ncbi:MAG: hypothetical protein M1832_002416 [Thelocarpon impressellum]|nr:MAG: hypothetical protein M1832_002416 [Thelocarpon impressellum]
MTELPHIRIAGDEIHPVRSKTGPAYLPPGFSHGRRPSSSKALSITDDVEDASGLREQDVKQGDHKGRQEFSGFVLAWLAYQSTGVIYGDIGTSPLYVYSSTFTSEPSHDDLLGVVSIIIWTLTLMVTIKYVLIVLLADDDGEGGTFALYSLLSRYANIMKRDPKEATTVKMERFLSSDLKPTNRNIRTFIEGSATVKVILKVIGVLGVSLVMADGVLTPAQSVLGAIQGLTVVKPDITERTIVGVTCAILILLFLIQPLGTTKIASVFAPVVIVWLLLNLAFSIYNLAMFDSSMLKAFSPYFAGQYFVRNKTEAWKSLGGILLVFTGVEALFADLGAFSRRAVQISWLAFAYPCLIFTYIGQAANISQNPGAYKNPFFNTVPPYMFYPGLVVSILAAIVASQAMITSTFQLLTQIIKQSYFPHITTIHTSKKFVGQVYVPLANWLLMIGTIIVTAVYHNTTKLGLAYGVCVILVTFITTCMVAIVALIIWRINAFIVLAGFIALGALDGLFLTSALVKVPEGAWFTLVLGFILSTIFTLWRYGKENQWRSEGSDRVSLNKLILRRDDGSLALGDAYGGGELTTVKGIGIFFDKTGWMAPTVYQQFLRKFEAAPEVTVFFHMRSLNASTIPFEERYTVSRVHPTVPSVFRLIVRHGYSDQIVTADLAALVFAQVRAFIMHEGGLKAAKAAAAGQDVDFEDDEILGKTVASELAHLQKARDSQVTYIVGKEQMRIREGTNIFRRIALAAFLWLRDNTRTSLASMKIPVDRLVEVGFINEI